MQLPSAVHISLRIFLHFSARFANFLPSFLLLLVFFGCFVFFVFFICFQKNKKKGKNSIIIVAVAVRLTF